jgi:hypothetical protein
MPIGRDYITLGVFKSKRSGQIYKVSLSQPQMSEETEVSCNCKGWVFNRNCKHIKYVENSGQLLQRGTVLL